MKNGISLAVIFFASAIFLAAAGIYQPSPIVPPAPPREFRGAWIATVANKDWPSAPGLSVAQQKAELISLLDTAVRLKLNTIIFQVRPACDAMYASTMEPWSGYLTGVPGRPPEPYYDPLAFAIAEAHKRGLELHAWFNPFRAKYTSGAYAYANPILREHPDWVRDYGGQLWLDPGNPAVREYVLRVMMDVVRRYDVDGVQVDDMFYPYPVTTAGGARLPFPDSTSWMAYGTRSGLGRDDWRRQNINEFIQGVYQNIKATKPWVKFGVSPFGIWRPGYPAQIKGFDAYAGLYADSRLWLANGWLDYFAPQLYWPINPPEHSFLVLLNWWVQQNVKHRTLCPGLAAYEAGVQFPETEIPRQIEVSRAQPGASGQLLFHLRTFEENPALAQLVAAEYRAPALVPASPWLEASPPARPELVARANGTGWMFAWATPGGTPVAKWILQYYGTDYTWKTAVLPANQTAQAFSFTPEVVSVRAMSRAGQLGSPATVRTTATAAALPPAKSFWGSYKTK
jgi:uncharacterized lipoprotein YddW (UPF0748 family)